MVRGNQLEGEVSGAGRALSVELSNRAGLMLENSTEVGPVTIEGASAGGPVSENARGKAKWAVLRLGVASFSIAAGQSRLVVVPLSANARRLLARSRILSVRVTLLTRDPSGATHTRQRIVTLRRAKANHRKA
jgi:hypothetical protein